MLLLSSLRLTACILAAAASSTVPLNTLIHLSSGSIRGRPLKTTKNNDGFVYLGIPYAKPPIGQLRYAKTQPVKPWEGVLDCTDYRAGCMHNSSRTIPPDPVISEDCLYMNVFVGAPCADEAAECGVIYHVHGGGWVNDAPSMFPPDVLMDNFGSRGVIFVTVGYRLGSFGFWSMESDSILGNYGMYDMIEGLHWVQREISKFGGSPDKVVTMGYSSSSAGVSLLTLTEATAGLFRGAIMMSGSNLGGGFRFEPQTSQQFVVEAGCSKTGLQNDDKQLLECMRGKDALYLMGVQTSLDDRGVSFQGGPRMDGHKGLFPLPVNKLAADRRPYSLVLGTTANEIATPEPFTDASLLTACQNFASSFDFTNVDAIANACFLHYKHGNRRKTILSDQSFYVPSFLDAKTMTLKNPGHVYLYQFDHGHGNGGPFHADDLSYVLGIHNQPNRLRYNASDQDDLWLRDHYCQLFANFANFGDPTVTGVDELWLPFETAKGNYYSIDYRLSTGVKPHNKFGYHNGSVNFWTEVAPRLQERLEARKFVNGRQQQLRSNSSNTDAIVHPERQRFDWQTAFWIVLSVVFLLLIILAIVVVLKVFSRTPSTKFAEPEERTRLLSTARYADSSD